MQLPLTPKLSNGLPRAITTIPFWILSWPLWPAKVRALAMRPLGPQVALSAKMRSGVRLHGRWLSVGERSVIESSGHLDATGGLIIGDDVHIGPGVTILTTSQEIAGPARRAGATRRSGVEIEDGVWIGAGATILAGVLIASGAVIAEGAVVGQDCAPDTLYAGVPAHPVRPLPYGGPLEVVHSIAASA